MLFFDFICSQLCTSFLHSKAQFLKEWLFKSTFLQLFGVGRGALQYCLFAFSNNINFITEKKSLQEEQGENLYSKSLFSRMVSTSQDLHQGRNSEKKHSDSGLKT